MMDDLDVVERSMMKVSYDDVIKLNRLVTEGQAKREQNAYFMDPIRRRFPSVHFLNAESELFFFVVGEEKYVNMVRDCIYNARKMGP